MDKQTHQIHRGDAPATVTPVNADGPARPDRRRLAGLGIAGGVILTLKSPSAMGANMCRSPSGAMSGALSSRQPVLEASCRGMSPAYWAGKTSPLPPGWTTFGKVFPCTSRSLAYSNTPLLNILKKQTFDNDKVGMYLMAAYFNAYTGRTTFLKAPAVVAIWNEWQASGANQGGTYTPIAGGKKWNSREIVAYLASTME